jgi:Xaa-Pro dipeptidase
VERSLPSPLQSMNPDAVRRLREWLEEKELDRIFLYRPENFAWVTSGADNTVVSGEPVAVLEVDRRDVIVHTSSIEERRFAEEETPGLHICTHPWWTGLPTERPNDLERDLTMLRLVLSSAEIERFRRLGKDAASATGIVLRAAKPHWTERILAGAIAEELIGKGMWPSALLAAGERRITRYRHPLPQASRLGRVCMAVVCAKRHGLTANLTRMRSWDHPDTPSLYEQVLTVEARALDATRPGKTLANVIKVIRDEYASLGHAQAFEQHHQGGIAGYRSREILATPDCGTELEKGMAIAWNPSLAGAKVEDTFVLSTSGLENLTSDPVWPTTRIQGRDRTDLLVS